MQNDNRQCTNNRQCTSLKRETHYFLPAAAQSTDRNTRIYIYAGTWQRSLPLAANKNNSQAADDESLAVRFSVLSQMPSRPHARATSCLPSKAAPATLASPPSQHASDGPQGCAEAHICLGQPAVKSHGSHHSYKLTLARRKCVRVGVRPARSPPRSAPRAISCDFARPPPPRAPDLRKLVGGSCSALWQDHLHSGDLRENMLEVRLGLGVAPADERTRGRER